MGAEEKAVDFLDIPISTQSNQIDMSKQGSAMNVNNWNSFMKSSTRNPNTDARTTPMRSTII